MDLQGVIGPPPWVTGRFYFDWFNNFLDDNFQTFYVTERPTVELLRMVNLNGGRKKKEADI